jgi:hypothetical protein
MTEPARQEVIKLIEGLGKDYLGLHGDCVGADADFDTICQEMGLRTVCRPCTYENMRAYTTDAISEPVAPMQRNRDIVADAKIMIAVPPNFTEIKKGSGTWATVHFTRRAQKPLYVVFPDGSMWRERTYD